MNNSVSVKENEQAREVSGNAKRCAVTARNNSIVKARHDLVGSFRSVVARREALRLAIQKTG